MLKSTRLPNILVSKRNNGNISIFKKNFGNCLIDWFGDNSEKLAKKPEKLFKSQKLTKWKKKLSKNKNLSKFNIKKNELSYLIFDAKEAFNYL